MACPTCPALGVFTKVLLSDGPGPYTWDDSSTRLEIIEQEGESIRKIGRIVGGQGITGKHYRLRHRKRFGGFFVYGQLRMNPSYAYFGSLLKYLVGPLVPPAPGDPPGDRFITAPCLEPFGLLLWRDLAPAWEYTNGVVAGWRLSSRGIAFQERGEPDLLQLEIDVVFRDETRPDWPDVEPVLGTGVDFEPYVFQDCSGAFVLREQPREVYQFQLEVSNMLSIRYANSLLPSSICSTGRHLQLRAALPWSSGNADLYEQPHAGFPARITFQHGIHNTEFRITNLTVPPESPYTANRREIAFEANGEGYGDSSTNPESTELAVRNFILP